MCRSCGAIVGADQSQCSVCGALTTGQAASHRPGPVSDRETMRFARAVLSRPYKFTVILLVANLFVFLLMWQSSGMTSRALWEFPEPVLIAYGAKLNRLIDEQHQWWRFVTPMFVHINLPHLLVNMYSLWIVGPYVEKLYGSAKFIVFWVLTGIAGVVASYLTIVQPGTPMSQLGGFLFKTNDFPSAGASGALFGLVGVLFVFGIKFRKELPEGFKRAFGTGMLPIIIINLFIGYLGRGLIDNAAHLGGLVSGAALALVAGYRRPGEKTSIAITWQVLRVAAIAIVAASFIKVAQHFNDQQPSLAAVTTGSISGSINDFVAYSKAMHQAQEAFFEALKGEPGGVEAALQGLKSAPHLDQKAGELKETLEALLLEVKKLRMNPGLADQRQKEKELTASFVAWSKQYGQWLKTEGKNHGGLIEPAAQGSEHQPEEQKQ